MNKMTLRRAVLAAAISTVSSGSMAAGFFLNETSTSGLGRAFAAENTIGDNASILARNPAGSALFDTISLSGGVTYVDPEIDAEGDVIYFTPMGATPPLHTEAKDYASDAFVPNAYLAVPINEQWSFGLATYTNYGLETDFDSSFAATNVSDQTSLLTVNIAPSVAYNFEDVFSVGVSLNMVYADAELKTKFPNQFPDPSLQGASVLDLDGDDWDYGWSIGALWNVTEQTRVGLSYHSEFDPKLEGDVKSDVLIDVNTGQPFNGTDGELTLDLPDYWELGVYHRLNENWGLAFGATYTDWDDFVVLEAFLPEQRINGVPVDAYNPLHLKDENFESGWRLSAGVEYYPCEEVTWRIGYAYDEGAAPEGLNDDFVDPLSGLGINREVTGRTLSIPDTDRNWLSFGGTYKFDNHLSIDGGFSYLWGDDEDILEVDGSGSTYFIGETTNIEAFIAAVSLNYSF